MGRPRHFLTGFGVAINPDPENRTEMVRCLSGLDEKSGDEISSRRLFLLDSSLRE